MEKLRCSWANKSVELQKYHDQEYGFPVSDDFLYFERLTLEIFQAGLSWETILKKRPFFREAFDNFDFYKVAQFNDDKINELLNNDKIIRNKLKIRSTVYNASKFIEIVKNYENFGEFLKKQPINDKNMLLKVFKKHFKFMGPLILEEFMMSVGFWKVKHEESCFLYEARH